MPLTLSSALVVALSAASLLHAPQPALKQAPRAAHLSMPRTHQPQAVFGYHTEAAASKAVVHQIDLADEIALLRVAAANCAHKKDLDAQRTLLAQAQKVENRLGKALGSLKEQVSYTNSRIEALRRAPLSATCTSNPPTPFYPAGG